MSHILRLIFTVSVILFSVFSKASSNYSVSGLEETAGLKRIIINGDSVVLVPVTIKEREQFLTNKFILGYRYNNLTFELTPGNNLVYQYFLRGFDREWSTWRHDNSKEYTNLPAGHYSFQVRYREAAKMIGQLPDFSLRVLPPWYFSRVAVILYLIWFSLIIWGIYIHFGLRFAGRQYMLEQIINNRTEDLIIEKEKTEALLANVLPKNTASEIMTKGKATKMTYTFVTVLFSDIQGFTRIAEELNTEVLIDELDKFFFYFDSIVEKYRIEKIKTIGDAYMCAGGIPEKNRTNPVEVILAALEMKAYMNRLKETSEIKGMQYWDIRIGIHTGPVVAGVVGRKKLSYDIWGDTVNTASRMESSGEAGKINISGTTYEFVKEFFECEFRGKMPVKYKGELEMYFVKGIIPDLCEVGGGPKRKFVVKMLLIRFKDIEEMILRMFDEKIPSNLYFHNSLLVRNISDQVERLSKTENLAEEDFLNIRLASVFLYTGFISDYDKPMEGSLRLVEEILPAYGYDRGITESVARIIRNSFTDNQESLSDNILHDARYEYLGSKDYRKFAESLLRESAEYGKYYDNATWIEFQRRQLSEHDFITTTARALRSVPIDIQMAGLQMFNELSDF